MAVEKLSERMFEGFSRESVDFLWNIRFNNYRSWYQGHKEECRRYVDGPMKALAAQLLDTLSREHPEMGLVCKVSRIYRDTRRLYGRPPYRDCMWFSIFSQVRSPEGQTSFYFELAPERYSCGLGCWGATSQTMARLRGIVDRDPRRVEGLMRQLEAQGEFQLESRPYKRPKGDPGPLLAPLYNSRYFSINCDRNCEGELFTPELYDQVLSGFRFLVPWYNFLQEAVWDQKQPQFSV